MENRFSRASSSRSATASDIDDALYPAYHHYRPGPSLARRPVPSPPSRDNYQLRPPSPENIFADPVDSPPPSPTGSAFYSNSIVTPTPSVRRTSSARRSPSPLPGGNGAHYTHHRLSQSLTPSDRSSSSSTHGHGGGLNRSNTTGTNATGYSTLSSIPSNLSDFTSPPSPLPSIAPVRPQWNYGGHQQNIYPDSVHTGSVVPEEDDPFADDFVIPVGDGFAPHHQRPAPVVVFRSGASVGGIEPPPYTRYPDQPEPEEVGVPLAIHPSNGDSGIDVGRDRDGERRSRQLLAAAGGSGLLGGAGIMGGIPGDGSGGGGGDRDDPGDDDSGAVKEWERKRVLGIKLRAVVVGLAITLVVLLAVGLGVGLGIGLKPASSSVTTSTIYPTLTATSDLPPPSEETGPPISSPNDTFPAIPTGLALINPIMLGDYSPSCDILAEDRSSPAFFNIMGADLLWSCQSDQSQINDALSWQFKKFSEGIVNMDSFISQPKFLQGAEFDQASWGGYVVSSVEGIEIWEDDLQLVTVGVDGTIVEYSGKPPWRDGTQNQPFWHIPLALFNNTDNNDTKVSRRDYSINSNDSTYNFAVFFNKTVIIKETTIMANIEAASISGNIATGNGSVLHPGEIVWRCVWEKTLLEVEIFVDTASRAAKQYQEGVDNGDGNGMPSGPTNSSGARHGHPTSSPHPHPHPPPPPPPPPSPSPSLSPPPPPPPGNSSHDGGDENNDSDNDDGNGNGDFYRTHPTPSASPQGDLSLTYKHHPKFYHRRNSTPAATPTTGSSTSGYPLRISVKESRPSTNRIRQLLGMDLTDPDPQDQAELGKIKCTQYIVTGSGGLTPFVGPGAGDGYVVLKEQTVGGSGRTKRRHAYADDEGPAKARKNRIGERNPSCFCRWTS